MKNRTLLMLAIASIGFAVSPSASALYKCASKSGITYQDKPCMEAPVPSSVVTLASRDVDRTSPGDRLSVKGHRLETEQERQRIIAEKRKAAELAEHEDWLARAARKSDSVRSCMMRDSRCDAAALRVAALYLSEGHLESVLGTPQSKQGLAMGSTSQWTVRINDAGRLQTLRLTAAWGLCSDDRNYFASGHGQRACKISIE